MDHPHEHPHLAAALQLPSHWPPHLHATGEVMTMPALLKMERKLLKPCVNHVGTLITTPPPQHTHLVLLEIQDGTWLAEDTGVRARGGGASSCLHMYTSRLEAYICLLQGER